MDDKFHIIPGKPGIGETIGYAVSGIAQITAMLQKLPLIGDTSHREGESDVEILNDYVARDIANAFTRAYEGKYTRSQLRQKLIRLLSE